METSFVIRNWGSLILRGIISLAFGIILIAWPSATVRAVIYVFGIFALAIGVVWTFVTIWHVAHKEKWGTPLAVAAVGLAVGIICLARPGVPALTLLYLIVIYLLASGAIEMAVASKLPKEIKYRGLLAVEGIAAIVVGILLMIFPSSTVWAIILFISIYAICAGVLDILVGFLIHSYAKEHGTTEVTIQAP